MIAVDAPGWQGARSGAHSPCVTDEQRRQPGWIGRENDRVAYSRALIEFKVGVLVRHGRDEWYFELDDQAHALDGGARAKAIDADHGGIGLPASNVATVELWAFRGGREIHGRRWNQRRAMVAVSVARSGGLEAPRARGVR